ncbi:hypothetical protein [Bosea thiooxidans]
MIVRNRLIAAILTSAALVFGVDTVRAAPAASAPAVVLPDELPVLRAKSLIRDFFKNLADDDDDGFVHDDHYDWQAYRDSTSRKERVRDYLRMQNEMQKDAFRAQKNAQKEMIKRQRGW